MKRANHPKRHLPSQAEAGAAATGQTTATGADAAAGFSPHCRGNCRQASLPLRVRWLGVGVLAVLVMALAALVVAILGNRPADNRGNPARRPAAGDNTPHRPLLDAIWMVESSGRLHPPDGDGGRSIGPYQISRAYWQDAVEFDPSLGGQYEDCRDKSYAERVVLAYWRRYVPDGPDEYRARVHNGGPAGYHKAATVPYWQKVQRALAVSAQ